MLVLGTMVEMAKGVGVTTKKKPKQIGGWTGLVSWSR